MLIVPMYKIYELSFVSEDVIYMYDGDISCKVYTEWSDRSIFKNIASS